MEISEPNDSIDSGNEVGIVKPSGSYKEVEGDLIKLALAGEFDVIAHGCNCFCTMGAGIAPQMARHFGCDEYSMEQKNLRGNYNKMGCIDWGAFHLSPDKKEIVIYTSGRENEKWTSKGYSLHYAVNCYTQYGFGRNHKGGTDIPLDYAALNICLKKINAKFPGKKVGLPQIGCGLAGGDWVVVKDMIKKCMSDCFVTVVIYKPEEDGNSE